MVTRNAINSTSLQIGSTVEAWDSDLDAVAALSSNGYMVRTGSGTAVVRTISAGTGISVSQGDGVAGNTTISADGSVARSVTTQSGTVTPSGNAFTANGSNGITTSGTGSTLTITGIQATTSQIGISTLATSAEAVTGTDPSKLITPSTLSSRLGSPGTIGGTAPGNAYFGSVSVNGGTTSSATKVAVAESVAGTYSEVLVSHTDNTDRNSGSSLHAKVGGASGGNAVTLYEVPSSTSWITGLDNGDGQKFKISTSFSLGVNDRFVINPSGQIILPAQPAFVARKSATTTNVTGDGATYQIIYDTVIKNVGSCYDSSTGVYTAPVTGSYLFTFQCTLTGLTASNNLGLITLQTSNRNYQNFAVAVGPIRDSGGFCDIFGVVVADMDAGDTAFVITLANGTGRVVGVVGDTISSYFTGFLLG